ncbi:PIR protein [Plasmodium ovale]|uniref:PIR protein n=1 Tax=Plasmodium ovale TaxID=36330 RepID=A0A1D3JEL5_PLAOA|nr:PIR protein [Plasmodium ovale]
MTKEYYEYLLHSRRNYRKLNSSNYAKDGNTVTCKSFEEHTKKYPGFKNLCMKLTGIIKNFDELKSYDLFDHDRCTFVHIWTYDKLFNEILEKEKNELGEIITWIFPLWYPNKNKVCNIHTNIPSRADYEKLKMLYDYATDHQNLQVHLRDNSYMCTENFKNYLEKNVSLYNDVKSECKDKSTEEYCNLLKVIDGKYPGNKLPELKCIGTLQEELLMQQHIGRDRPGHIPSAGYVGPDHSEEMELPEQGDSHLSNAMAFVFPLFCIILTFLILYKFTSFGPWIHSRFLKKKIIESDIDDEGTYEFLERPHMSMNIHSQNGTHNIGYHSM